MQPDLFRLISDTVERELPHLRAVAEERSRQTPFGGEGWTTKEELGHLLDSAANNHIRFVAAALSPGEFRGAGYAQDAWVTLHGYQEVPWDELIELWRLHNRALARVIGRIPAERLGTICTIGSEAPETLRFVIEDYVLHMQHHIDHLLARERITTYPAARD